MLGMDAFESFDSLDNYVAIDDTWPPTVYKPKSKIYVGVHGDMEHENYWHNVMKAFEENRYGRD